MKCCTVEGCSQKHKGLGLCGEHYWKFRYYNLRGRKTPRPRRLCEVDGCGSATYGSRFCGKHRAAFKMYGDPLFTKRRLLEYNGERKTKKAWADAIGISLASLNERLLRGWPVALAVTMPKQKTGGKRHKGVVGIYRSYAQAQDAPPAAIGGSCVSSKEPQDYSGRQTRPSY